MSGFDIEHAVQVLNDFSPLIDICLTQFYSDNYWSLLDNEWRENLEKLDLLRLLALDFSTESFPKSLQHYIQRCNENSFSRSQDASSFNSFLQEIYNTNNYNPINKIHYRLYHQCNQKKKHEILPSVQVIQRIVQRTNATHIVDIGSGVGYLSFAVAATLQIPVLGLELQSSNCIAAEKRKNTICSFLEKERTSKDARQLFKSFPYKVDPGVVSGSFRDDIMDMIVSSYPLQEGEAYKILLVGLHTCGDLAASILRFFCEIPELCAVYNLGCCYNRLTVPHKTLSNGRKLKEHHRQPLWPIMELRGFPLSETLSRLCDDSDVIINRRLMLLGCQSIQRDVEEPSKTEKSLKVLAFRTHLERMLKSNYLEIYEKQGEIVVGNIPKREKSSFASYATAAMNNLRGILPPDYQKDLENNIANEMENSELRFHQMIAFRAIRNYLSNVTESIILEDRKLYIQEKQSLGNVKVLLANVFDPKDSPRNIAIVAMK